MMLTPHALACRMLRRAGKLDFANLPPPRRSESVVDWLVRAGIAETPQRAARGLLVASGLDDVHRSVVEEVGLSDTGHTSS